MSKSEILIYTDGSSRGNPGPGGYGTILIYDHRRKELSKGFRYTTNNRMELMAVIAGLEALKKNDLNITIFSDSKYVVDAVEKGWLKNWVATDFKGGKKNKDLWLHFFQLSQKYKIRFVWVKGHSTNAFNNRCDELATSAADGDNLHPDFAYEKLSGV